MPDILENMTEAEIKEETEGTRRLARHEAESNRVLPQYYDLEGNYVYWLGWLTRDSRGNVERSFANLCLVLELDPKLSHIGYNQFTDSFEATGPLPWREKPGPWRDSDDAQLMRYVDQRIASFPMSYYPQALAAQADRQGFHPVRQYFWNLPIWDEVPRVDTLLIDYLGAQDSPYVRAVTRKTCAPRSAGSMSRAASLTTSWCCRVPRASVRAPCFPGWGWAGSPTASTSRT